MVETLEKVEEKESEGAKPKSKKTPAELAFIRTQEKRVSSERTLLAGCIASLVTEVLCVGANMARYVWPWKVTLQQTIIMGKTQCCDPSAV